MGYTELNKKPEDNSGMFAEERKQMIVDIVNRDAKTTVAELCERFAVSPVTIRADLRELEESKLLTRTHGGAIANKRANYEKNTYQKEIECMEQKRAIAQIALAYVDEGDTIAIDTGTTMYEFAKLLTDFEQLNVVTNDLQIALYLEQNSNVRIILAGGEVRTNFHCTVGQRALDSISDLNVDRAFIAANGVDMKRGLTTPDIPTADVKRKLVELGQEVVLLADSSKIGKSSFVRFADMDEVDVTITDEGVEKERLEQMRAKGAMVEVCKVEKK